MITKKFTDAQLSIAREHMSGIMALLKFLYDVRLPRFGTTKPNKPLFPVVARDVSVNFYAMDPKNQGKIQLNLKNVGSQNKYTTLALLILMIYDQKDGAYEWIVDRYCAGMRVPTKSNTAGKERRANESKKRAAEAVGEASAAAAAATAAAAAPTGPAAPTPHEAAVVAAAAAGLHRCDRPSAGITVWENQCRAAARRRRRHGRRPPPA